MAAALPRFTYNSINIDINTPLKTNNDFDRTGRRDIKQSLSGIQQTAYEYNEFVWDVDLTFVTGTIKDTLFDMWDDWAVEGKNVTFYPDYTNSPGTSYTGTIISNKFEVTRVAPGLDYWNIKFQFRKNVS